MEFLGEAAAGLAPADGTGGANGFHEAEAVGAKPAPCVARLDLVDDLRVRVVFEEILQFNSEASHSQRQILLTGYIYVDRESYVGGVADKRINARFLVLGLSCHLDLSDVKLVSLHDGHNFRFLRYLLIDTLERARDRLWFLCAHTCPHRVGKNYHIHSTEVPLNSCNLLGCRPGIRRTTVCHKDYHILASDPVLISGIIF